SGPANPPTGTNPQPVLEPPLDGVLDLTRGVPHRRVVQLAARGPRRDIALTELEISIVQLHSDQSRLGIEDGEVSHGQADVGAEVPDRPRPQVARRQMKLAGE